jgi:predicted phosphodiesterase
MLAFLGDIHGNVGPLVKALDLLKTKPEVTALIQVGDFGFYPNTIERFRFLKSHIPIYAIDGNHEHFPMLVNKTEITEMVPNVFYVPRGTVMELDGRKIGFIGGAASVDKDIRLRQRMAWYPEEVVTEADIKKFDGVDQLDILVTHTPPQSIILRNFDQNNLLWFGLPPTWIDPSAVLLEKLWLRLCSPKLYAGHMHKSVIDGNVRILDIGELCYD